MHGPRPANNPGFPQSPRMQKAIRQIFASLKSKIESLTKYCYSFSPYTKLGEFEPERRVTVLLFNITLPPRPTRPGIKTVTPNLFWIPNRLRRVDGFL